MYKFIFFTGLTDACYQVTKDWRVKVCDFGLSRSVNKGNLETFKKLRGTFAYCAPEVFRGESCTAKSDVFSMGIVVWELMHVGVLYVFFLVTFTNTI